MAAGAALIPMLVEGAEAAGAAGAVTEASAGEGTLAMAGGRGAAGSAPGGGVGSLMQGFQGFSNPLGNMGKGFGLDRMWGTDWALDKFNRIVHLAGEILPSFTEGVLVNVYGSRQAKFADLYNVAMAAAWGAIRPMPNLGAPCSIKTYVNRTARHVMVEIAYSVGGMTHVVGSAGSAILGGIFADDTIKDAIDKIVFPPSEEVVGAGYSTPYAVKTSLMSQAQTTLRRSFQYGPSIALVLGIADAADANSTLAKMTLGEQDGQVVVTTQPAENPRPFFDGVSRNTDITAAITQALWNPLVEQPPPPKAYRYRVKTQPESNGFKNPTPFATYAKPKYKAGEFYPLDGVRFEDDQTVLQPEGPTAPPPQA